MVNLRVQARSVWVAATLVALPGCSRPPADGARTAQPALTTLSRTNVSIDDRAAWRQHLQWPDSCEEAFQASRAGTDGGLMFTSLGDGVSLVEVVCAAGAYQPSVVRMRMVESAGGVQATVLVFPVYRSEDGRQVTLVRETEVWGESVVQASERHLVVLALARQTADCGVWTQYSLAAAEPRMVDAAARLDCPTPATDPVTLSATEPPRGWASLRRKD